MNPLEVARITLLDALAVGLDLVAVVAVLAFTAFCLTLSPVLQGSALKRGFTLAALAGLVHIVGSLLQVARISDS